MLEAKTMKLSIAKSEIRKRPQFRIPEVNVPAGLASKSRFNPDWETIKKPNEFAKIQANTA
jgi:hypothetical protein